MARPRRTSPPLGKNHSPGGGFQVILRVNKAPRAVKVPADLRKALGKSKPAQGNFEEMVWSHRRAYVDWIEEAKQPETRARRIVEAVKRIAADKGAFDR